MHGGGEPNKPAVVGLGPALFLVETNVLGLGMVRTDRVLSARGRKHQRAGEDEERSNGESGCGNHVGLPERLALNLA
jgi:hypothetical protein